ncbi:MAG: hypothetical protein AAF587_10595 [Bacteroidota bacterium]
MKHLILLVVCCCSVQILAQEDFWAGRRPADHAHKSIEQLVTEIAQDSVLMSRAIGIGGLPNRQYSRFQILSSKASKEDLLTLTDHPSPVVRSYTFWALADQKVEGISWIARNHLSDTARVRTQFGCVGETKFVADFYLDLLTQSYLITEDYYRPNHSRLEVSLQREIDSLVLRFHPHLDYFERLLMRHEPIDSDYEVIRAIVEKGNYLGLPALARYQKKQDLAFILSFQDSASKKEIRFFDPKKCLFLAIEAFPDDYFLDFLEIYVEENWPKKIRRWELREFYKACASYGHPRSQAIMRRVLDPEWKDSLNSDHFNFLATALGLHAKPYHEAMLFEMWEQHNRLSIGGFQFLSEKDPARTAPLLARYFANFNTSYHSIYDDAFFFAALPFAIKHIPDAASDLLVKKIGEEWGRKGILYGEFATQLKREELLNVLLEEIAHNFDPRTILKFAEFALSYERDDIPDAIRSAWNHNDKLALSEEGKEAIGRELELMLKEKK